MRNLRPSTLVLLFAIFFFPYTLKAQCDSISLAHDSLHFAFVGNVSTGGLVYSDGQISMAKYNDTVYFAGNFVYVGKNTGKFARLKESNGDMVGHYSWPRANGKVMASAPDGNGGWVIAGDFTKVGDSDRYHLAHITSTGQVGKLEIQQMLPASINNYPEALVVEGNTVYIGGSFYQINGQTRNNLAAFSLSTGNLSSSWNPGANNKVTALASDGTNIYVGGTFSTLGSSSRSKIGAVQISSGNVTSFNPGLSGFQVNKFIIDGNKVYTGGRFTSIGGTTRRHLAVIDKNTGNVTSFNPNIHDVNNYPIRDMVLVGGKLYIVGTFDKVNNINRAGAAALDTATGNTTSWDPNVAGWVHSIATSDSSIILGGQFTRVNAQLRPGVAVVDTGATATLKSFDAGMDSITTIVRTVQAWGGNIYFGGEFNGIKGAQRSGLAAIDIKNNKLLPNFKPTPRNTPTSSSTFNSYRMNTIAVDNGIVYVGGVFDQIDGVSRKYAASFSIANNYALTNWNPLNVSGTFASVTVIKTNGNYAYIGGRFEFVYNGNHEAIVRVNKTSGVIDTWTPASYSNATKRVYAISFMGSRVYFGGDLFNSSSSYVGMQHYDFSNSSNHFYPFNNRVTKIQPFGNSLYVAGNFTGFNTTSINNYAKIDTSTNGLASWSLGNTALQNISWPTVYSYKNKLMLMGNQYILSGGNLYSQINLIDTATAAASPAWHPSILFGTLKDVVTYGDTILVTGKFWDEDMGSSSVRNTQYFARFDLSDFSPASVSITASDDTVCAGASVTATATTAISNASYEWRINDTAQSGTNATFTFTPDDNDTLTCIITVPQGGCSFDTSAVSNEIVFKVNAATTTSNTLMVSADTVCSGDSVHFTTGTNIMDISYQWKVGSTNVGANVDTFSYVPANGDVVSCTFKALSGCYTVDSMVLDSAITVHADTAVNVTITASANPLCPGDADTFTSSVNITGATYQWRVNGSNVTGATADSYSYSPLANDAVECIATATLTGCYEPDHDTSNSITLTTLVPDTAKISITASSNPVPCISIPDTFTATGNIATGAVYVWKVNGSINSINTLTYTYTPANNDVVTCDIIAPAAACYVKDTVTSNAITVTVNQPPSVNTQPSDLGLNVGKTAMFTCSATGTALTYQWQVNTGSGFNDISDGGQYIGTATNTLTVSNISAANNNHLFRCVVAQAACPAYTNGAKLSVFPAGVSSIAQQQMSVYPNPVDGLLYINAADPIHKVEVVNLVGVVMQVAEPAKKACTVDMSNLANGMYIIRINNRYQTKVMKR